METKTTLQIRLLDSYSLGSCYSGAKYEILTRYEATEPRLTDLFNSGFIGCGQEFRVLEKSKLDLDLGEHVYRAVCEVRCDSGD
jgi:hypothetical protein